MHWQWCEGEEMGGCESVLRQESCMLCCFRQLLLSSGCVEADETYNVEVLVTVVSGWMTMLSKVVVKVCVVEIV